MTAPLLTQYIQGVTILSADGLNTFEQTCDTFNDLRSFNGTAGIQVYARGQSSVGDGYQGVFYWNATGAGTDDNVNNIVPSGAGGQWTRIVDSLIGTNFYGLSVGTAANDLVQLNSSAQLPAVDGSLLTNLPTQVPPVVGQVRNGYMSVASAAATATFTADEVVVQVALAGAAKNLAAYSQTINLGSTGAGGMDTGSAPASGFVSLYAIYGVSGTSILACNVTASQGSIYAGGHMPAGYTYSGLIGIWPTNGSSQFVVGVLNDRKVFTLPIQVISSSAQQASYTSVSLATAVPPSAKSCAGYFTLATTVSSNLLGQMAAASTGVGQSIVAATSSNATGEFTIPIVTSQTAYYLTTASSGTLTFTIVINSYNF